MCKYYEQSPLCTYSFWREWVCFTRLPKYTEVLERTVFTTRRLLSVFLQRKFIRHVSIRFSSTVFLFLLQIDKMVEVWHGGEHSFGLSKLLCLETNLKGLYHATFWGFNDVTVLSPHQNYTLGHLLVFYSLDNFTKLVLILSALISLFVTTWLFWSLFYCTKGGTAPSAGINCN